MEITEPLPKQLVRVSSQSQIFLCHFSPLFLIQHYISMDYGIWKQLLSPLSNLFFKQNSSLSFLADCIFLLFLYLQLFPKGWSVTRFILSISLQVSFELECPVEHYQSWWNSKYAYAIHMFFLLSPRTVFVFFLFFAFANLKLLLSHIQVVVGYSFIFLCRIATSVIFIIRYLSG